MTWFVSRNHHWSDALMISEDLQPRFTCGFPLSYGGIDFAVP
jgi:hypothetical protein